MTIKFSKNDINYIIEQYSQCKMQLAQIAKKFNISIDPIYRILKIFKINHRKNRYVYRKYKINENYFSKIDNENKAYFLGYLYADGNLRKNSNEIRLMLQKQDMHILKSLSNEIYGFNHIKTNKQGYVFINICSQIMHADLIKLGCTPKKTFTITFPTINQVPDELMHHFIRGYFDGDGTIGLTPYPRIHIVSNEFFFKWYETIFRI